MVKRLKTNGQLDSSFGNAGIVRTPIRGTMSYARTALLLPDGRILVAGSSVAFTNSTNYTLVRYKTDGSRDSTFGTNGIVTIPIGIGSTQAASLLYQSDGSVILVGNTGSRSLGNTVAMICLQPDGSLKSSFGNGGKVIDTVSGPPIYVGAAVQLSDGEIIVGGTAEGNVVSNYAIARYYRNGQQDRAFNDIGYLMTQVGESYSYIMAMAVQPDDKVLAAGWSWGATVSNEFAVARYKSFTPLDVKPVNQGRSPIHVYPNPVSNSLTIECAGGGSAILVNSIGQQVSHYNINGMRQVIDVSLVPASVYFLRIIDAIGRGWILRIVKQ
jgi:uncharacterized delta-60 repeat protein